MSWPLRAALAFLRTRPISAISCSESTAPTFWRSTTCSSPVACSSLARAWARSVATGPCHHQVLGVTVFLKSGTDTVGRPAAREAPGCPCAWTAWPTARGALRLSRSGPAASRRRIGVDKGLERRCAIDRGKQREWKGRRRITAGGSQGPLAGHNGWAARAPRNTEGVTRAGFWGPVAGMELVVAAFKQRPCGLPAGEVACGNRLLVSAFTPCSTPVSFHW